MKIKIAPEYNLKFLETDRPQPLVDNRIESLIQEVLSGKLDTDISDQVYINFKKEMADWLAGSELNNITGFDSFHRVDIINGCTQFIDNIYSVVINRLEFVYVGTIVADLTTEKIQAIPVIVKKEGVVISTIFADKDGKFEFNGEKNSSYSFEINQQEFESVKEDYSTVGKTASDSTFKNFVLVSNVDAAFTIVDEKTKQNLRNAKVEIVNNKTNQIISVTTNEKGLIELKLPRNNEFEVRVSHANYIDSKTSFSSVTKDKVMASTIGLNKIEVGAVLAIKDLNYDYNKWNIKPESKVELNKVVAFLKENPNVKIELSSHTDSRGLAEFNLNLSKKRNQSCTDYLVSKGVKKDRVIGKWYGESMLLNKCADSVKCSEGEHWKNRRTTIVVVSID